jgi:hypothetical protein
MLGMRDEPWRRYKRSALLQNGFYGFAFSYLVVFEDIEVARHYHWLGLKAPSRTRTFGSESPRRRRWMKTKLQLLEIFHLLNQSLGVSIQMQGQIAWNITRRS